MMEPVADDSTPERIWAGDFNGQGFGHCVAGMQGGLYEEYVLASRLSDAEARIAELEAKLVEADALIEAQQHDFAQNNIRNAENAHRAEAAEALLKEAGNALEPFALILTEGIARRNEVYTSVTTCTDYFRDARAIHHKIGGVE